MKIRFRDNQGILSEQQVHYASERLRFSLARFEHRVNVASMHFSIDDQCEKVTCRIDVSIEGVGVVSVKRSSNSSWDVMGLAVDAVEPIVACQIDWRMWFNLDTFSTCLVALRESWKSALGWGRQPGHVRRYAKRERAGASGI